MNYIWLVIKGMLMGIANIIPGVSGGTMALSLGIYDDLISSISHLTKDWRNSLRILLPLAIGLAGGIVGFSYLIEILLNQYTFPTALAFIGLILGGIPMLWLSFKKARQEEKTDFSMKHLVVFLLAFGLVAGMAFMQESEATLSSLELTFGNVLILFFVGIIASATMVVPGVSGSLILMIMGYYYKILNTVTGFADALRGMDINALFYTAGLLIPFGIGVLLGIFLISRAIDYLFQNQPVFTYSAILGLVLASPFAILFNTHALGDLAGPHAAVFTIVGILLLAACSWLTFVLGKTEEPAPVEQK